MLTPDQFTSISIAFSDIKIHWRSQQIIYELTVPHTWEPVKTCGLGDMRKRSRDEEHTCLVSSRRASRGWRPHLTFIFTAVSRERNGRRAKDQGVSSLSSRSPAFPAPLSSLSLWNRLSSAFFIRLGKMKAREDLPCRHISSAFANHLFWKYSLLNFRLHPCDGLKMIVFQRQEGVSLSHFCVC